MSSAPKPPNSHREEFLVAMYERMWENISRSITLSWQPFVVLLALGAIFSASLAGTIPVWFATSIGVIVVAWFFGHIYDANEWVWRNHLIVANLEYYFLDPNVDKAKINPFLGDLVPPERAAKLFSTMRPHFFFASALAFALVVFEVIFEIIPGLTSGAWPMVAGRSVPVLPLVPIAIAAWAIWWIRAYKRDREAQYKKSFDKAMSARKP